MKQAKYFEGNLEKVSHKIQLIKPKDKYMHNCIVTTICGKIWIGFPGTIVLATTKPICKDCK
jgi:hypothetical protein